MGAGFMTGMDCKTYLSNLQCKGSDRHQKVEELFQWAKGGIYVCICLEECREMKSEMCLPCSRFRDNNTNFFFFPLQNTFILHKHLVFRCLSDCRLSLSLPHRKQRSAPRASQTYHDESQMRHRKAW